MTNATASPLDGANRRVASRIRGLLLTVLVLAATAIAYLPAMQGDFIWDDDRHVTLNPNLRTLDGLEKVWIPGETPHYYPLVFTSFWVEYQLWELDPLGYHVVNVFLHAITALLVWRICARLGLPGAWLIGAVFALHPVHVESVAWITERKNVLSAVFYMLSFLAYLRFEDGRDDRAQRWNSEARPWPWYALAMLLFVCALLSKSVTFSLPLGIALALLYQRRSATFKRFLPLVPMLLIGVGFALNTARLETTHVLASGDAFDLTFFERVSVASRALLFYPYKLLIPAQLTFIYPRWDIDAGSALQLWPIPIILVVGAIAIVAARRGHRGPLLALLFYAISIAPALGFFHYYPMLFSFVADHFQYIASLGIIALVTGAAVKWIGGRPFAPAIAAVVLVALGTLTWFQGHWYQAFESDGRLWEWTIRRNPECWMAHAHYAIVAGAKEDFDSAEKHLNIAREIKPDSPLVHANLAALWLARGELERALDEYREAAALTDWFAMDVGRVMVLLGRDDEAEDWVKRGLEQSPGAVNSRIWLAERLLARGEPFAARDRLLEAVKIEPRSFAAHRLLGDLAVSQKQLALAPRHFRKALEGATSTDERRVALKRLSAVLSTLASKAPGRAAEAIARAREASALAGGSDPDALGLLARAYAMSGRLDESIETYRVAISIAREAGNDSLMASMERDLSKIETRRGPGPDDPDDPAGPGDPGEPEPGP